ncbi:MAG: PH domain-containing protein [Propionibacteriaceae bacterium]|jgi:uncharacterized membrane protein YdbT with pleckstrin-like domain|nr:PH domain-containing protein [Propionibacteriaceae bacterium]
MGLSKKLLGEGEKEILHLHTHMKKLFLPIFVLILEAVALGLGLALTPDTWHPSIKIIEIVLALIIFVMCVFIPYLKWRTTTYTFTDRRIITRKGIINKDGHDLPLSRINDISYERSLTDRILGCGTLVLTTASEKPVKLDDIPHVEQVHVMMTELLFGSEDRDPSPLPDEGV